MRTLNLRGNRRVGLVAFTALGFLAIGAVTAGPSFADTPTSTASTAATTTAATVAPSNATSSTLTASRTTVTPRASVKLTGLVRNAVGQPVYNRRARFQQWNGKSWTTVAAATLSSTGHVYFTVKPAKSSTYRLAFYRDATHAPSVSPAVVVKVRALTSAEKKAKILAVAAAQKGKWYRWGSAGPSTFDCSGLTLYAYRSVGVRLPHSANSQLAYGHAVSRSQARPGDLIIFMSGGHGYHAAIYAGGGYMYDAPHTGAQVGKHKIYSWNLVFRRIV